MSDGAREQRAGFREVRREPRERSSRWRGGELALIALMSIVWTPVAEATEERAVSSGSAAGAAGETYDVRAVSPGAIEQYVQVTGRCPTFSWTLVPDAVGYELSLFAVDVVSGEPVDEERSWYVKGAATTWTPSGSLCLEPGAHYAWFVRAGFADRVGPWSQPLRLAVAREPSLAEVEAASDVLTRFLEARERSVASRERVDAPSPSARASAAGLGREVSAGQRAGAVLGASLGGTAAIRGQSTAVTGDANGVVGISSSPNGAGVVAAGAGVGVDLVLDGSTSATTDTLLSQDGIDRRSDEAEVFRVENTGGGSLSLEVSGDVSADSFSGDGSGLSGVAVADIECSGCVGGSDIGDSTIQSSHVQDASLTGDDLANGTISAVKIVPATITSVQLAANSVHSSEIASGAVGQDEIASNSVGSVELRVNSVFANHIASSAVGASELAAASVGAAELKSLRVVAVECNGECADSTLSQICGSGYSVIAVDCDIVEPDDSTAVACGGDNVCERVSFGDFTELAEMCTDGTGFDANVYCIRD